MSVGSCGEQGPNSSNAKYLAGNANLHAVAVLARGGNSGAMYIGGFAFRHYLKAGDLDTADEVAEGFGFLPERIGEHARVVTDELDGDPEKADLKERIRKRYQL